MEKIINVVWEEFLDIKFKEFYVMFYLEKHKLRIKLMQIITLVLSLTGVFGWKFFEEYTLIVLISIAVLQLFDIIKGFFMKTDVDIMKIEKLRMEYTDCATELEKLWIDMYIDDGHISWLSVKTRFLKIKEDSKHLIKSDVEANIFADEKIIKKASVKTRQYAERYG